MRRFQHVAFDPARCARELGDFAQLLLQPSLKERRDILPFFRRHQQLTSLLGSFNPNLVAWDRVAFELPLVGTFVPDVVVMDSVTSACCFVEFEDATPDSIFVTRRRNTREWSPRFEHAFGQIVDWLWVVDDLQRTTTLAEAFGSAPITAMGLLISGRDTSLSGTDQQRLEWRRNRLLLNSEHVYCCTFDELYRRLARRLDQFALAGERAPAHSDAPTRMRR